MSQVLARSASVWVTVCELRQECKGEAHYYKTPLRYSMHACILLASKIYVVAVACADAYPHAACMFTFTALFIMLHRHQLLTAVRDSFRW